MSLSQEKYQEYIYILEEEMVVALGCTEPIALAFAAAKARETLGQMPRKIIAHCSPDIIKNVKCVTVPNTGNLKGVCASVLIGAVGGKAEKELEVLADITEEHIETTNRLMDTELCEVEALHTDIPLCIVVEMSAGENTASVEIRHTHTNIHKITKNGTVIFQASDETEDNHGYKTDRSLLNVSDILEFANTVEIEKLKPLLDSQIKFNLRIAEEGLSGEYGVGIGKMLLESYPNTPINQARAYASAASEARMSGCSLPVVINSGSGNQGITASVPVVVFGRAKGYSEEKIYRALIFSNLLTIHQKSGIGRLSAFCGAVCAACASGAAMAYMDGGTLEQINMTISNTLANVSGIICDGAKPSCGAKIASALDAAIMAYNLAMNHNAYQNREGILQDNIEGTIDAVGRIGRFGMSSLDREILSIMLKR
jgi:L-cysteine desulfidase